MYFLDRIKNIYTIFIFYLALQQGEVSTHEGKARESRRKVSGNK